MWSITHIIVLEQMSRHGLKPFYYEDFYLHPFKTSSELLLYLGYKDIEIHPSCIFTPSMMTLKTTHEFRQSERDLFMRDFPKSFWQDQLSEREEKQITLVISKLAGLDSNLYNMLSNRNYLVEGSRAF